MPIYLQEKQASGEVEPTDSFGLILSRGGQEGRLSGPLIELFPPVAAAAPQSCWS